MDGACVIVNDGIVSHRWLVDASPLLRAQVAARRHKPAVATPAGEQRQRGQQGRVRARGPCAALRGRRVSASCEPSATRCHLVDQILRRTEPVARHLGLELRGVSPLDAQNTKSSPKSNLFKEEEEKASTIIKRISRSFPRSFFQ